MRNGLFTCTHYIHRYTLKHLQGGKKNVSQSTHSNGDGTPGAVYSSLVVNSLTNICVLSPLRRKKNHLKKTITLRWFFSERPFQSSARSFSKGQSAEAQLFISFAVQEGASDRPVDRFSSKILREVERPPCQTSAASAKKNFFG